MSEKREELELVELGEVSEETKAPFLEGTVPDQTNPIRYRFPPT